MNIKYLILVWSAELVQSTPVASCTFYLTPTMLICSSARSVNVLTLSRMIQLPTSVQSTTLCLQADRPLLALISLPPRTCCPLAPAHFLSFPPSYLCLLPRFTFSSCLLFLIIILPTFSSQPFPFFLCPSALPVSSTSIHPSRPPPSPTLVSSSP